MSPGSPILRIRSAVIGEGERVFVLGEKTVSIGRGEHCDIVLLEQSVSRNHARVEHDDGSYVIIDDGSASGIHVGGQRVARRRLADGDEIEIGDTKIQFVVSAHSQPTIGGAKVRPTEIATNPPPSKRPPTEPVAAPARRPTSDFEGAATWASDEPLPSGQETQMPTDVSASAPASGGTEVAPHVPAPPTEVSTSRNAPTILPQTGSAPIAVPPTGSAPVPVPPAPSAPVPVPAVPSAPVPVAPMGSAPMPVSVAGSAPIAVPVASSAPMPVSPVPSAPIGVPVQVPVASSAQSTYELGGVGSKSPGDSQFELTGGAGNPSVRPPSSLRKSSGVGVYIAVFVVGVGLAFGAAMLFFG